MTGAISDREQELLRQQNVLARFGELALRSNDLNEILDEACRLVGDALGVELSKVMELQADGSTLLVKAGTGWPPGVVGEVTIHAEEGTSESYAIHTHEPVISADIGAETRFVYPQFIKDAGAKALAIVLIIGADGTTPYGLLQVDSRHPRAFTDADITFLRTYANLIAASVKRLQVASELRSSEDHYRASVEFNPQIPWTADPQGQITGFSDRWLEFTGLTREQALGNGWQHVPHPDDLPNMQAAWQHAIATGEPVPT